jgi:hypothetical protein
MTQQKFKVGDKVFDILFGWGKVVGIHELEIYGVMVRFEKTTIPFTFEGKHLNNSITPTLSHTEYRLISEPAFPRMMEVRSVSIDWVQREVISIHNGLAITHEYGSEYRFWEHYREIQQKTKITIAEIAEKFGLDADKIEIVS